MIKAKIVETRIDGVHARSQGCYIAAVPRRLEEIEIEGTIYEVQTIRYHAVPFEQFRKPSHVDLTIGVVACLAPANLDT